MPPHVARTKSLLGKPGSRYAIPSPAAIVDSDALDRNLRRMAERAHRAGLALRPHAKTHKSAAIAHRQIEAGAIGICCAKLAEAEAMAAHGIESILVTSPIAGTVSAERTVLLARTLREFAIVVDHPDGAEELARASGGGEIRVLIDVDVGQGRTGVRDITQAMAIFEAIRRFPNLQLKGLQGYGGQWQHIAGAPPRLAAVRTGMEFLAAVKSALAAAGASLPIVTGGGTGTFAADATVGILTEVQPGSYAFMDREYGDALSDDPDGAFEQTLFIAATVISANHPDWVTVDAGIKAFATDGPTPIPASRGFEHCEYRFFGDEHGLLTRPRRRDVSRGDRIEFIPPHIDPTLDRYDWLHLVRGDVLVDIAPVQARGASQ